MVRWSNHSRLPQSSGDVPGGVWRVGLRHVLCAVERPSRLKYGVGRQREHLKEVTIKRNQVLLDERIAGDKVIIEDMSDRAQILSKL